VKRTARTDKNLRRMIAMNWGIVRIGLVFCYFTGFTYTQKAVEVKDVHSVCSYVKVD
jgi:hypothetical protein